MVYLQFWQLSSVLFWVNTHISKSFANILDVWVIQNRCDMYLPIFAAETKTCQGPVGLLARALELLTHFSNLTASPAAPAAPALAALEASHPHVPMSPGFATETCFIPFYTASNWPSCWPFSSPATGCLPIPITQLLLTHFPGISSQIQEKAATKRQFLAQMWHQLNNPDQISVWHIIFAFIWPWF